MNNNNNLNKMADYFDKGEFDGLPFYMRNYCFCALGHSVHVLGDQYNIPYGMHYHSTAERIFGFKETSNAGQFLFGSMWIDNPKAAAARFRYVALHGDAPSQDQWDNFQFPPMPVVIDEEIEEVELACV